MSSSPYRLEVIQAEVAPEPARVSCDDCRWFGGQTVLGSAMMQKSCHLWSTSPYSPGDPKLHDLRESDWNAWIALHNTWDFNRDGGCFGWAPRNPAKRFWKWLTK